MSKKMNSLKKMRNIGILSCLVIAFGFVFLGCTSSHSIIDTQTEYYRLDGKKIKGEDAELEKYILPYRVQLTEKMSQIIGYSSVELLKEKPESTMGNWMTDAMLTSAEKALNRDVDFAIQNYGGIRISSIASGPVTLGKMYEVMPFENEILVLELAGDVVLQLMDKIERAGGWPISSGVKIVFSDNDKDQIIIKNKLIERGKMYLVAMPDFVANGGDDSHFFKGSKRYHTGKLVREALIESFDGKTKSNGLRNRIEGRITFN